VAGLIDTFNSIIELDIQRGLLQRDDNIHERYRLAVEQMLDTAMAISSQALENSPLPPFNFNSGSAGLQSFSPGGDIPTNRLLAPPQGFGQSPMALPRGYNIQDSGLQSWTPRSQMENSTPSVSTQNSLVTQWGTPREFSTPATSSSLGTPAAGPRDASTVSSHTQSDTPGDELGETLGLPLQIEWDEEWNQLQSFDPTADVLQSSRTELGVLLSDSEQPIGSGYFLPEDNANDNSANNTSLMAILESENKLPTAGMPFKDRQDRNKGLQRPFNED
jgi:hypothetical protein